MREQSHVHRLWGLLVKLDLGESFRDGFAISVTISLEERSFVKSNDHFLQVHLSIGNLYQKLC